MKKLLSTLLILMTIAANAVSAVTLSDRYIQDEVRKQIVSQNKKYTDAEIKVIIANMPFSTVTIPDGTLKLTVTSNFDKFVPRDIKKVNIYSNGHLEKSFLISVRTLAYKNVLCARNQIERDSLLTNANTVVKKMEVSAQLDYILTTKELTKQMVSKKWFKEGEILDKRFVKIKPDVERNAQVQTYFKNNGVLISIETIALDEGMTGEYIKVQNKTYKRIYKGRVIGENKVLVEI